MSQQHSKENTSNNSYFFRLMVITLLIATPAFAQVRTAEIDKIFSWATSSTPGCACAVSQNGKLVVNRAYGLADLERDVPISPKRAVLRL